MKKLILLLLLFAPLLVHAQQPPDWSILPAVGQAHSFKCGPFIYTYQDYRPHSPNSPTYTAKPFYMWDQVWVDSLKPMNGKILYRTRRQYGNPLSGFAEQPNASPQDPHKTYPGFLGDSILFDSAQCTYTIQDGTVLYSKSGIGELLFKRGNDTIYLGARVFAKGVEMVGYLQDSVKYAQLFNHYSGRDYPILDSIDFVLSKHRGWLVSPQFGWYANYNKNGIHYGAHTRFNVDTIPSLSYRDMFAVSTGDQHIFESRSIDNFYDNTYVIKREYTSTASYPDSMVYTYLDSVGLLVKTLSGKEEYTVALRPGKMSVVPDSFRFVSDPPFTLRDFNFWGHNGGILCQDDAGGYKRYSLSLIEGGSWERYYAHVPFGCNGSVYNGIGFELGDNALVFQKHNNQIFGSPFYFGDKIAAVKPKTFTAFQIIPIPAKGQFTISAQGPIEEIRILSLTGQTRLLLQGASIIPTVDVRSLPAGLYLVEVRLREGSIGRQRLVLE